MMNLLSSHDTPRFLTMCKNDRDLALMGATIQFGWPGMPSVYYGEELGMQGARDPDNRRGMTWENAKETNPYLVAYRKLIHARNNCKALQTGEPIVLNANDRDKTLAFARVLGDEVGIVAANRSDKAATLEIDLKGKVPLSPHSRLAGAFDNVLSGERVSVSSKGSVLIRLEPKSAALLVPAHLHSAALKKGAPDRPDVRAGTVRVYATTESRATSSGRRKALMKSIGRHDAHKS
jgi:maltooligosyltrehalose synthase